jgi:hypothetical protein
MKRIILTRRLRTLDACVVLLSAVALLLIGLLRFAFAAFPLVPFLSTLLLFMVPGVVLSRWFFNEHISGSVMVPVSFTISAGIFGFFGVPMLILHQSIEVYLWIVGAILAVSLVAATFGILRRRPSAENGAPVGFSFSWLWIPFLLLSTVLAFLSRTRMPRFYEDKWVYLAWVREFLTTNKLALHEPYFGNEIGALSRAKINGWLLEQATFSRVSGIDPVELVLGYLSPTLVVMSLLAVYALAKILLKNEAAALLVSSLYALFFLVHLNYSLFTFGGEFIGRIAEDKFVARFLFLPVALVFAFLFLESRKLRYLMAFALLCWAVVAVHLAGLAIIGLSTAGFGFIHLAVNWRKREAWIGTVSLGAALLSVLLAPVLYVLATGNSLVAVLKSADISSIDPDVLANLAFVKRNWKHILALGDDSYIMHPSLLLDPVILAAFVLGLPFVLWRLKSSLAAQLLVGMMLVPTAVCFVPPLATFIGDHVVLPGLLWRLAWPIPLAALLTIGWMIWETARYAQIGLNRLGTPQRATRFLPLMLLCTLIAAAAPASVAGAKEVARIDKGVRSEGFMRAAPFFYWMQDNIIQPSVVLAPDAENTCIPAYSAKANVVSLRGRMVLKDLPALERLASGQIDVPQGALDVERFFSSSALGDDKLAILHRYEVDYVMLRANSPLNEQIRSQPGFTAIDTPGKKYSLYAVDRRRLGG